MAARRGPSDDELLGRLEAAGPLLADSRVRYRALVPALRAWGWRQRLRALADVADEVARTDEDVVDALARAQRRARAEAWPEGAARTLLEEVEALREELARVLTRRHPFIPSGVEGTVRPAGSSSSVTVRASSDAVPLDSARGERVGEPVAVALRALLGTVVGVPRQVPLGQREAAAQEALSLDRALVPGLERFAAAMEAVFSRPIQRARRLPFSRAEYDALLVTRPADLDLLAQAWSAVRRIDLSGGVERELIRRSSRAPRAGRARLPGPSALVRATFWRDAAAARITALLEERFAPVHPREGEHIELLRWLLAREADGGARLTFEGPRAALLMLAHELTAAPEDRAPLAGGRAQVHAWALEADQLEGDEDWRRLRDGLRALSARTFRSTLPPLYRVGQRLPRDVLPSRLAEFFN